MAETKNAFNVFISWSGPRSKSAAQALKEWLPLVVPTANPFMSATDIDKGTRWREEVATALDTMKAGIICLTPENLTAEWLLFEAGALSKTYDPKTRVWTYLLADLKTQHLTDPLAMFQATTAEKEETRKLIHSINNNLDAPVPERRVNHLFDKLWPDLEKELAAIPAPTGAAPPERSPEEMSAETLDLLRSIAPLVLDIATESQITRQNRLTEGKLRTAIAALATNTRSPDINVAVPLSSLVGRTTDALDVVDTEPTLPPDDANPDEPSFEELMTRVAELEKEASRRKAHAPRAKRKPDLNSNR
jgi:hypothetical protein